MITFLWCPKCQALRQARVTTRVDEFVQRTDYHCSTCNQTLGFQRQPAEKEEGHG